MRSCRKNSRLPRTATPIRGPLPELILLEEEVEAAVEAGVEEEPPGEAMVVVERVLPLSRNWPGPARTSTPLQVVRSLAQVIFGIPALTLKVSQ